MNHNNVIVNFSNPGRYAAVIPGPFEGRSSSGPSLSTVMYLHSVEAVFEPLISSYAFVQTGSHSPSRQLEKREMGKTVDVSVQGANPHSFYLPNNFRSSCRFHTAQSRLENIRVLYVTNVSLPDIQIGNIRTRLFWQRRAGAITHVGRQITLLRSLNRPFVFTHYSIHVIVTSTNQILISTRNNLKPGVSYGSTRLPYHIS